MTMVGEEGFEPSQTDPESVVLPLDDSPKVARVLYQKAIPFGKKKICSMLVCVQLVTAHTTSALLHLLVGLDSVVMRRYDSADESFSRMWICIVVVAGVSMC